MVERMNSDLANTLGNLVNRTISMTNKYFGGVVTDKGAAETEEEKGSMQILRLLQKILRRESMRDGELRGRCNHRDLRTVQTLATNTSMRQCHGHLQRRG